MLTDTAIKKAVPQAKQYKMADGKGLYLLIKKAGKYWRMDYRFLKKRKTMALGVYPTVKLKEARTKRDAARGKINSGIDPMEKVDTPDQSMFEFVAREWYGKNKHTWVTAHAVRVLSRLEKNIFPWLGEKSIAEITPPDLLSALRRVEERGAIETAHRIKNTCGQIFRYAVATGKATRDITADLRGAIPPPKKTHMATITDPAEVGGLLRSIDGYKGHFITRCALKLAPLTFVRPGELRHAEWSEINFEKAEWKIEAKKMKMARPHIIPLSRQSVEVLLEIQPYTAHRSKYVFPSPRTDKRPLSDNGVLSAIRRMGYGKHEMCGHGFRAMASTLLHENGFPGHIIELQLAHAERNSVKAAYNHALYLKERKEMMTWWAGYLDKLKLKTFSTT